MVRSAFQQEHSFEKRKAEAERIRQKYPDRIPVSLLIIFTFEALDYPKSTIFEFLCALWKTN
jgi:hypothetical protein